MQNQILAQQQLTGWHSAPGQNQGICKSSGLNKRLSLSLDFVSPSAEVDGGAAACRNPKAAAQPGEPFVRQVSGLKCHALPLRLEQWQLQLNTEILRAQSQVPCECKLALRSGVNSTELCLFMQTEDPGHNFRGKKTNYFPFHSVWTVSERGQLIVGASSCSPLV